MKGLGWFFVLAFLNSVNLSGQPDYYLSMGTSVITPKSFFVYRPEIRRVNEPTLHGDIGAKTGLSGMIGMKFSGKWIRYDIAFKVNYHNYKFTPVLDSNDKKISTRVSFPVYSLNFIPTWYIEKANLAAGFGLELQYAGKPRITSTGQELHNIIDENRITFGGIFHLEWDFSIRERDFFLSYQYIRYPDGHLPFQVQLLYNGNRRDLFVHQPKFNTHLIRIGYVFR